MNWKMQGLLFENCSCQLICPAHVSFKQNCTHELCQGHWAIHIREGHYQKTPLAGLNIAILFESPQRMYEGGWKQTVYIDRRADSAQRAALESVLAGNEGGPWEVLAQFVEIRLQTRFVDIEFEDKGRVKRMRIEPYFETEVKAIRARDNGGEAILKDLFNQIHGAIHVLARGKTMCHDQGLDFEIEGTHGLYSDFVWEGQIQTS